MNPWLIVAIAYIGAGLLTALIVSRFIRHGTDPDDYWPPEHGQLIAQVIREIAGQVEDMERLANTGELMAIVDATRECPPPTDRLCGCWKCRRDLIAGIEREVSQ